MASNFNNDVWAGDPADQRVGAPDNQEPAGPQPATTPDVAPSPESGAADLTATATTESVVSAAFVRFRSCRWQQPAEGGSQEFCTHREVKPYAGMQGFDAGAWCPECQYYKLRRIPKKRQPLDDYSY